uniref:CCR4-NOT transcription complex subunit 10 n=1 Tax=Chelonoidis abingdonii TaxID=106734 RepID=A0A8C0HEF2_CHEAB
VGPEKAGNQGTEKHEGAVTSSGITDQEKELSSSALQAFIAENYDACLQHLSSLQEINKDDYKITLNTAVAEFCKSNQTTTDNLKQTLNQLKNQVHSAVEEMDGLDDVENSMLYYNQAVILYHLRQYTEAISVGEKLYQFIEPFEEKFAQAVCFLLVDLYLLTYQAERALHLKKGIVQSIVGQGYHRKIVLASQSIQNVVYNDGQSSAIPVASMEFAAICLRNALLLLPEDQQEPKQENGSKTHTQLGGNAENNESSEACSSKSHEGDKFIPAPPSSPLRKQELENLRCSILACSAYVALALGDNLMALNHADKLLQQPKLSGSLKFLGHLYAAEALISLDRISDAITHLNPENVTDVYLGISSNEQDQGSDKGENEVMESSGKQTPQCYPSSVTSARTMMLFNLGSAYCLRSEYDKARKCLHQAASLIHPKEIPPEAILLAVYLELQNGNTQLALQIIKRNQLLPSVKTHTDMRKKPIFQPVHPIQPIQMPAFTTVQRK